ncbi:MAG: hypothetical protein JWQ32_2404 [Marmoricola sp.]|nr:hypothetical protein [Marmoricola sp.]
MRRITYWALSTVSAVALLFSYSTSTSGPQAAGTAASLRTGAAVTGSVTTPSAAARKSGSQSAAASSGGGAGTSPAATAKPSASASASRTVTGAVAQTQWGPVQVELTVASGSITKVSVLQYPSGNGRDDQINSYALPILIQETVQAQSASIDMVSGATVTSGGYLESLQSALDQAKL